ncbi:putative class I glutamine amidotransferase domain protein [Monocercomonoides exilis]|uniref:putative class I glutamine amidotransferase domain protein n=1 Tax=Monocercomonoides exilis TaxID=2049356 RepID=UPI00355A8900|nr:putative class I glutamine amidotransferase domain protein [Monocercomonoides exilis]|eukprot:MONOS_8289.1-p1 / transcript=MONOS_8289.1 / gene=MONOS_8289 / organism=Monocercomonoides_exilis_PA203 / gene_product=class I glutamine amidotransferase domain containing protein / transcript_product=class I glutamine amidotransferase domain containing protein / location=Mono_scaffold00309:14982-15950(+) / protein_length=264 / sequence_SO=supercontig / SO=protein_coding / is_pseudo=false
MAEEKKLICILNCEDHPHWEKYTVELLGNSFNYITYQVTKSNYPPLEETARFDGFIINGSLSAAYETEKECPGTWVPRFGQYVRDLVGVIQQRNETSLKKQRLVGICFGHQIIAHYLGGKCEKMEHRQYGLQPLILEPNFFKIPSVHIAFKNIYNLQTPIEPSDLPQLAPIETHGDCVSKLPPSANLIAKSENTQIEAFSIGESILTTQFHPEFTNDIVENELIPHIKHVYPSFVPLPPETSFKVSEDTSRFFISLVRSFLAGL